MKSPAETLTHIYRIYMYIQYIYPVALTVTFSCPLLFRWIFALTNPAPMAITALTMETISAVNAREDAMAWIVIKCHER